MSDFEEKPAALPAGSGEEKTAPDPSDDSNVAAPSEEKAPEKEEEKGEDRPDWLPKGCDLLAVSH